MKKYLVLLLVAGLAGCSQTTAESSGKTTAAKAKPTASASRKQASASSCEESIRQQSNAAAMGSALGMVGGFGGFGGRGGAVAAHVASSAGSMVAQQQAAKHRQDIERNCY